MQNDAPRPGTEKKNTTRIISFSATSETSPPYSHQNVPRCIKSTRKKNLQVTLTHRHTVSSEQGGCMKAAHSGLRPLSPHPFSLSLSPGWELTSPGKDTREGHQPHRGTGRGEGSRGKDNAHRSSSAFPCSAHSPLVPVPRGSVSVPCPSPALGSPPRLPRPGPAPAGSSPHPPGATSRQQSPQCPPQGPAPLTGNPSPHLSWGLDWILSLPHQHGWRQPLPGPTAPSMPREPTWPPSSPCPRACPRTTAPSMPRGTPPTPP